jgi:N-acetylmuramoyl-L-alanine amidase
VSRARNNDPDAPLARYFVIHDTSGPNYGHRDFPSNIDTDPEYENLADYACSDGWGRAHVFVNRTGDLLVAHDYSIAWRETKFEQAAEFGGELQGLFVHNELVQPRKSAPHRSSANDAQSPDPAFTAAQYDRIALLYTIASVRAGRWLIPAFHAALDADIPDGHDDPLNFDIQSFADSLDRLVEKLGRPAVIQAAVHQ